MRARTAIQGSLFLATIFWLLPRWFASRNAVWSWPVWELPGGRVAGWLLIAAGVAVALHCSNLFRTLGRGTPVPIEPPRELVVAGLYRYSRNPIYVADVAIVLGIFLVWGHAALLLYAAILLGLLEAWVVLREEPVLRRRFGAPYEAYCRRVPRWLGRATAA